MPPVIAALTEILTPVFGTWSAWVATVVVNAAAAYAISTVFRQNQGGLSGDVAGRMVVSRSPVHPRNIIYGDVVTSGPLLFATTKDRSDGQGPKNGELHVIIGLAAHEVEEIGEIWLNDRPLKLPGTAEGAPNDDFYTHVGPEDRQEEFTVAAGQSSVTVTGIGENVQVYSVVIKPARAFSNDSEPAAVVPFTQNGRTVSFSPETFGRTILVSYTLTSTLSWVWVRKHLGSPDQQADGYLMNACPDLWTSAHRLQGIAYIYLRLIYNTEKFPTGIPNIKARVKGKKIYDPRTGATAYSNNWALCVYDYLRSPDGLGCAADDVDLDSVIHAANVSDEFVPQYRGTLGLVFISKRYTCDGVLTTDKSPADNLRQLASAGGGPVPVLAGGVFRVHAGAYDIPAVTLTESDLRGPIKVRPRKSRRDLCNAVRGTCVDGEGTWLATDFPPVRNTLYRTEDGEEIFQDIELPFTTSKGTAQRLAKITLERARQGIVVEFPAKLTAFKLSAWDTVNLSIAKFGWTNKVFRVAEWKFSGTGGVDLVLVEEAAGIYEWNFGEETTTDLAPDTNLPKVGPVPAVSGLRLNSGGDVLLRTAGGGILSRILAQWTPPTDAMLTGASMQIEFQRAGDTNWTRAADVSADSGAAYITGVVDRVSYVVRARYESRRGAFGDWTYTLPHEVVGKTAPPANVPWFLIEGDRLSWGAVTDIDLAGYRIKFHYGVNRSWSDATPLHTGLIPSSPFTPEVTPQGQITLMIKAVDTSGNESLGAASIGVGFGDILVANVVEEFDFSAAGYAANFITEELTP